MSRDFARVAVEYRILHAGHQGPAKSERTHDRWENKCKSEKKYRIKSLFYNATKSKYTRNPKPTTQSHISSFKLIYAVPNALSDATV
jgi:hypothetical protein